MIYTEMILLSTLKHVSMNNSALNIFYLLSCLKSSLFVPAFEWHCTVTTTQKIITAVEKWWHGQNRVRAWVSDLLWKKRMLLQSQAPTFPHFRVPTNVFSTPVRLNIPPPVLYWWEVHSMRQSCIFSFFMSDMEELIVLLIFFLILITVGSLFINAFLPWKRKYI